MSAEMERTASFQVRVATLIDQLEYEIIEYREVISQTSRLLAVFNVHDAARCSQRGESSESDHVFVEAPHL
jgi:hypothetical protein